MHIKGQTAPEVLPGSPGEPLPDRDRWPDAHWTLEDLERETLTLLDEAEGDDTLPGLGLEVEP